MPNYRSVLPPGELPNPEFAMTGVPIRSGTTATVLNKDNRLYLVTTSGGGAESVNLVTPSDVTNTDYIKNEVFVSLVTKIAAGDSVAVKVDGTTVATLSNIGDLVALKWSGSAWVVSPSIGLAYGTYTPTLTNLVNVSASLAYLCNYLRVGNMVTVTGKVDITPTASAADTQLDISLPFASNLAAVTDCSGVSAAIDVATESGAVRANTSTHNANLRFMSVSTTNHSPWFSFTYRII